MKGYKIILCMLEVVIFLCFSYVGDTQAQVNPQQTLFYQATPRTHSWTVNGTTYNNNRNPFGIEMNVCIIGGRPDLYPKTIQDACIPQSVTINGNKWWRGSSGVGISCRELQPQYDGPRQWTDSRTTSGTGQQNINLPVCTAVKDQRSTVNFIDVSKQFTYYSTLCQNGNQVVLAPRADIYDPECQNINYNTIIGNPQNYSQRQRSCLLFADDQADITACKNGVCKTHTYHPDDPPRGRLIPTTYENVCSIFSQGDGTYNVSVEVYDTGQVVYGSSSLYLTWLSNSITGNVFIDTNKNGIKDASESNYLGPISLTVDGNNITIPTGGRYTIPNLRPETTHTISYTSLPTDYIMSYPLNGPPSTYQVTVGSSCTTNGALGATCTGDINNLNFAITDSFPWIQTTCGDVRIDNGVTNEVPIGQTMIKTNTSCTSPGVVFTGDTRAEFGKGQASSSNQVVGGTNYPEVYDAAKTQTVFSSYANLLGKAQAADITPISLGEMEKWPGHFWWVYLAIRLGGEDAFLAAYDRSGSFSDEPFVQAGEHLEQLVALNPFPEGFLGLGYGDQFTYFANGNIIYVCS